MELTGNRATLQQRCKLPPMSALTFDTLKFVERLEKAGVPREQAAAMAEAQKDALSEALDTTLATKADFLQLESTVQRRMDGVDAKVDKLTWVMGVFVAVAIANFAKQFF